MEPEIFKCLDRNYIERLFKDKKLIYFPDLKNKKIEAIDIEKKSPVWQQETCLVKYKIIFDKNDYRMIWGTASRDDSRKKTWKIMDHLFHRGFDRDQERIARPLDYINKINLLLYEEADGISLSTIIQGGDSLIIKESLVRAAKWLSKLHDIDSGTESFSGAYFLEVGDYISIFAKINELMPDLKDELISASGLDSMVELPEEKILIHNDFYPGNIIIGNAAIYGIDFEKSGIGSRLMDVAALFGWFEFPAEVRTLNLYDEDFKNFQNIFLETYCNLAKLNKSEIQKDLKKFIVKVFLDQIYICATLSVNGWKDMEPAAKNDYQEKIRALLKKIKYYISSNCF